MRPSLSPGTPNFLTSSSGLGFSRNPCYGSQVFRLIHYSGRDLRSLYVVSSISTSRLLFDDVSDTYAAVVSLYVPGGLADDGVPVTADPIGTDSTGHTTWVLAVGSPSGTFTASETAPTSIIGAFCSSVLMPLPNSVQHD